MLLLARHLKRGGSARGNSSLSFIPRINALLRTQTDVDNRPRHPSPPMGVFDAKKAKSTKSAVKKSKVAGKARDMGSDKLVLAEKDSRKPKYVQKTMYWTSDRLPCADIVIRSSPEHCEVMDVSVQDEALKVVYEKGLPKLSLSVISRII